MAESLFGNRADWRQGYREAFEFPAAVLAALAEDGELSSFNGKVVIGAELGERYGIRDDDGEQPISYRFTMGAPFEFGGVSPGEYRERNRSFPECVECDPTYTDAGA